MSDVPLRTIGVIGAGQMGGGIAQVAALAGFTVRMSDIGQEQLDAALATMARNMERQIQRGRMTEDDKAAALARISTDVDYAAFADCDLVIEAATEKLNATWQEVAQRMYASASTEEAQQATGTEGAAPRDPAGESKGPSEGEGPVEADYEILDEEDKK